MFVTLSRTSTGCALRNRIGITIHHVENASPKHARKLAKDYVRHTPNLTLVRSH